MSTRSDKGYREVEVSRARTIAKDCHKDIVVILSWDKESGLIHTTTFGESPEDKINAANLGDMLAQAAGADITQATTYEDFRAMPIAKAMELLDLAWGVIANAGGGNWETEKKEWQEAAVIWRDRYHMILRNTQLSTTHRTNET